SRIPSVRRRSSPRPSWAFCHARNDGGRCDCAFCGKNRRMRMPQYFQHHAMSGAGAIDRYTAAIRAPFAVIGIRSDETSVTSVAYLPDDAPEQTPQDRIAARTLREIERYLADPEFRFTVPLRPGGTAFQRRVWNAITAI